MKKLILVLVLFSCTSPKLDFSLEKWNEYEIKARSKRKVFVNRDKIVDDLISRYLQVGTSQAKVESLLGATHFEGSKLTYPLTTHFHWRRNGLEIGRDLVIELDSNREVVKTSIISWSH